MPQDAATHRWREDVCDAVHARYKYFSKGIEAPVPGGRNENLRGKWMAGFPPQ